MKGGAASCEEGWAPQSSPPAHGLGHSGYDFARKEIVREIYSGCGGGGAGGYPHFKNHLRILKPQHIPHALANFSVKLCPHTMYVTHPTNYVHVYTGNSGICTTN